MNSLLPEPKRANQIGRYELIGLLATGGMAEVYLAMSGELSGFRTLAVVKRVLPHLSENHEFITMFFDEARIAAQLDHPNIARIVEVGQDGDEYFLAMEVVQGRPLSALLRRANKREQPLSHAQSAFVIAQAAKGLAYAHNLSDGEGRHLGVVHRDVSPQNILVSFEGAVKLIDFGVARALGRVTETVPGGLKGKIQYMSPEQASGGRVDRRSDVFALGIVLWEALCGRRLFRRESDLETLRAIVHDPIPSPPKSVRISPRLERIMMKALQRDPDQRFQNADEMALALERHAFASEGFSPAQLPTAMKTLFAADFARWRRTVAAAMDLSSKRPEAWGDTSGTFLRPPTVELRSRGATMALHPMVNLQETGPLTGQTPDQRSDSRSAQSEFTLPDLPPRPRSGWFVGGALALTAAFAIGVFALTRTHTVLTVVQRPAGEIVAVPMATPPPTPAPSAGAAPTLSSEAAAAAVPQQSVESEPGPATTAPATPATAAPPVASAPVAPPTGAKRREDALQAAWAGAEARPAARASRPAKSGGRASSPSEVHQRKTARSSVIVDPWERPSTERPSAVAPAPGASEKDACSVRLGTQPWAEVWIDGKKTGGHTPYLDKVSCGVHTVTFKRPDLGRSKTYTITVKPGESLRQSFPFE